MKSLKPILKKISLIILLLAVVASCKKDKKVTPAVPKTSMTAKIDGKDFTIDQSGLSAIYYSTDGDPVKALQTSATLNPAGDKLVFFLNDLKTGTQELVKKSGTAAAPGTHVIKLNAGGGGGTVQTYVSYFNSGNTYYALSGFIEIKIDDTSISVRWEIKFTDATGRVFESSGSFVFNFYTAVTKSKSEVTDPTPVVDKPTIESISPTQGNSGTEVTINGANYSTTATEDVVKFNGIDATVKSATATKLVVTAPQGGSTGPVSVKVKNSEVTSGPAFTYVSPATLVSVSPKSGKAGDIVTLTGTNFSTVLVEDVVKFNGVAAVVKSASATQITVEVPQGAKTGPLTLVVKGGATLSGGEFVINVVTLISVKPLTGKPGDLITLTGTNFSAIFAEDVVKFNGIAGIIKSATATKILVTVPQGAKTGPLTLQVKGGSILPGGNFVVIGATITSMTPSHGKVGDVVTISGTGFSTTLANNAVKLGDVGATVKTASATKLTFLVPQGAKTGKVTLSVSSGVTVSAGEFVMDNATVTDVTPRVGKPGDVITITGTGFSAVPAENVVKFNNYETRAKTASATKLTVVVPQGASSGYLMLSVKGGLFVPGGQFVVNTGPAITSVSPNHGKIGDIITINGSGFSTVLTENVVKFSGKQATVKTASATKLTVAVPIGAVTGNLTLSVKSGPGFSAGEFVVDAVVAPGDWADVGFSNSIRDMNTSVSIATTNKMLFSGGPNSYYLFYTPDGTTYTNVYSKLPFNQSQLIKINKLATDNGAFFVTTNQGVARSFDGINWLKLTPDASSPNMGFTGIVARRNTVTLISPPSPQGKQVLYTSNDGGLNWTHADVTSPATIDYITSDSNGKYFYGVDVGNNAPGGTKIFYHSTNQGLTWTATAGHTGLYFYNVDYLDFLAAPNAVFLQYNANSSDTAPSDQRLYRSTGQGDSWVKVSDEASSVVKAKDADHLLYGGNTLNVSADGGYTFKNYKLPDGYIMGNVEQTLDYTYIFCYKGSTHRIFRAKLQ